MKKILIAITLLVGALTTVRAKGAATLQVSATIVPSATLSMIDLPADVVVTTADVRRGFVELEPLRVAVSVANGSAYTVNVRLAESPFRSAVLAGAGAELRLSSDATLLREARLGGDVVQFVTRLTLDPDTAAGRYPFPLSFTVGMP